MNELSTKQIADALGTTVEEDKIIKDVVIDTRQIVKDCLFVCIKGENFDGNDFADKAIELGAAAVLCTKEAKCSGTAIRVDDTRKAFLQLTSFYRSLFNIPVVALTGSVGKTTTKEMIHLALSAKFNTLKTLGNFNNEIGLPRTLLRLDDSIQAAVIEMGMSHFGEISTLSKTTKPTTGVITNIGVSHIENLGSREGIFKAKMEIVDGMDEDATLILNGDDDFLSTVTAKSAKRKVIFYGVDNGDFRCDNINEKDGKTSFTVHFFGQNKDVVIPTIGIHNVYNALAALAVAYVHDVDMDKAIEKLASYQPEGMRQKCVDANGVTVIEDCYNASPDSMKAALRTLASIKANKRIAVLADMLELGDYSSEAHFSVGKMVAENKIDYLFAYGKEAIGYIKGAESFTICKLFETKQELADELFKTAESGDAVLFKASRGMKLEDSIHIFYEKRGIEK